MSTQVGVSEEMTWYVFLDGIHASWCREKCMAHKADLVNIRDKQKQKQKQISLVSAETGAFIMETCHL